MTAEIPRPFTFDHIQWNGSRILRDEKLLVNNFALIKTLLDIGHPTYVLEQNDYARNLPYHYDVGGIQVEFLPHWGQYKIDGKLFYVPNPAVVPQEHVIQILKDDIAYMQRIRRNPPRTTG